VVTGEAQDFSHLKRGEAKPLPSGYAVTPRQSSYTVGVGATGTHIHDRVVRPAAVQRTYIIELADTLLTLTVREDVFLMPPSSLRNDCRTVINSP
jgi:hypothetical protein